MGVLVLSAGACNDFDSVPISPPDELGAAPFPEGATIGGLDATFGRIAEPTDEPGEDDGCGSFVWFRPDGTMGWTGSDCPRDDESFDEFVERTADAPTASRGDYAVIGQRVWMRLVYRQFPQNEMVLYSMEAEVCGDRMTTYVPGSVISRSSGLPVSRNLGVRSGTPPATADPCDVASFTLTERPYPYIGAEDAQISVSTEPGRQCSLSYVGPDGVRFPAEGTVDVIADGQGDCVLVFSSGSEAGDAIATVTVGPFARDLEILVLTNLTTTTTSS